MALSLFLCFSELLLVNLNLSLQEVGKFARMRRASGKGVIKLALCGGAAHYVRKSDEGGTHFERLILCHTALGSALEYQKPFTRRGQSRELRVDSLGLFNGINTHGFHSFSEIGFPF